jgi:DNA-binding IclR family transcriptional regulator
MPKGAIRASGREAGAGRYNVRAVERALGILNAFSFKERELTLNQVTAKTGLSKPTVFRILSTLEHHSYVSFDASRGSYRLGAKFLELGGIVLASLGLQRTASPHLDRLQGELKVTIVFGALMDDQLVFIDKRESEGPIRIFSEVGLRRSPTYGMLGMVLMAFLEEGEVRRLLRQSPLEPYTRFSLTDDERFVARLREIRERGYLVEENEAIEGVWGVGAPVYNAMRQVVAAVGAALPLPEKSAARVAEVIDRVCACAAKISADMGYLPR